MHPARPSLFARIVSLHTNGKTHKMHLAPQLAIATLPRHAAVLANRCLVHAVAGRAGAAYADVSRIRYCRAKHFARHYEHMRAALQSGGRDGGGGGIVGALAAFEMGARRILAFSDHSARGGNSIRSDS
jgi:hypothetical protein